MVLLDKAIIPTYVDQSQVLLQSIASGIRTVVIVHRVGNGQAVGLFLLLQDSSGGIIDLRSC